MFLPNLTQDLFDTTATAAAVDLSSFPFGVSLVNATIDPIPGSTGSTGENTYTSTFIEVNRGTVLVWRGVEGAPSVQDPVGDIGGGLYRDNRYDIALAMPSSGESPGTIVPLTVSVKVDLFPTWPSNDIPEVTIVVEEKGPVEVLEEWEAGVITPSSVTTESSMKWPIATWSDIVTNTGFQQLWIGNIMFPRLS